LPVHPVWRRDVGGIEIDVHEVAGREIRHRHRPDFVVLLHHLDGRDGRVPRLQPWDSTISSVKMMEQDYEIWSVTVPYLSAGDLMNIYFDSANIPTPNRMNWKDAETDAWLKQGRAALTEADRARYYALVQQKVTHE